MRVQNADGNTSTGAMMGARIRDNSQPETHFTTGDSNTPVTGTSAFSTTTYFVQTTRDGNDLITTIGTNSYGGTTGGGTQTVTQANVTGLRYLKFTVFSEFRSAGDPDGTVIGNIDDFSIDDGVTTYATADITQASLLVDDKATLFDRGLTAPTWTKTGTNTNINGGIVEIRNPAANDDTITYPLGLTVDGNFVLRFKFRQNSGSGGNGECVYLTNNVSVNDATERVGIQLGNQWFYINAHTGGAVIQSSGGTSNGADYDVQTLTTGTWYYGELKRAGNVYSVTFRTGSHTGTQFGNVLGFTKTSGNHTSGTMILVGAFADSGAKTSDVDDIEFWDDTTDVDDPTTYTQDFSTDVASNTSNLPENTLFEETDTYKTYWLQSSLWQPVPKNALRGLACGGQNGSVKDIIDYFTIATVGNATDFGNLTLGRFDPACSADATRGITMGGANGGNSNIIDYVTVATAGNATDFGDMIAATKHNTGLADATRGLSCGGYTSGVIDAIDYVTILTTGNASDFGNLTTSTRSSGSCADATRGLISGGYTSGITSTQQYITVASTGNGTNFGNLTTATSMCASLADSTRGLVAGGDISSGIGYVNTIEYNTIQTPAVATDFGDLTIINYSSASFANATRGIWAGGGDANDTGSNVTGYVTIQTTGNATDFGDLTAARRTPSGLAA